MFCLCGCCWCCCCSSHSPPLFAWKTVPTPRAGSHEGQCAIKLTDRFTLKYRLARVSAKLIPLPRRQNCANSKGRQPRRQMCRQVTGGQEELESSHPRSRRVRQHAEHTTALDPPEMVARTLADQADAPSSIFHELSEGAHGAVEARVLDEAGDRDLVADVEGEAVLVGLGLGCRLCGGRCRRRR